MSIFDTYRVVYTDRDFGDVASPPLDRDNAMARFDEFMAGQQPLMRDAERVRVISEKVWIESQAAREGAR